MIYEIDRYMLFVPPIFYFFSGKVFPTEAVKIGERSQKIKRNFRSYDTYCSMEGHSMRTCDFFHSRRTFNAPTYSSIRGN